MVWLLCFATFLVFSVKGIACYGVKHDVSSGVQDNAFSQCRGGKAFYAMCYFDLRDCSLSSLWETRRAINILSPLQATHGLAGNFSTFGQIALECGWCSRGGLTRDTEFHWMIVMHSGSVPVMYPHWIDSWNVAAGASCCRACDGDQSYLSRLGGTSGYTAIQSLLPWYQQNLCPQISLLALGKFAVLKLFKKAALINFEAGMDVSCAFLVAFLFASLIRLARWACILPWPGCCWSWNQQVLWGTLTSCVHWISCARRVWNRSFGLQVLRLDRRP